VNNKQRNYREQWWLHANRVEQAGPYLAEHGRLLALTCVSQYLTLAFVPRGTIIQDRMMLFLLHQDGDFAVLQSRVHEVWVKLVATSLGDAMSYTTQCFDTFPRPAVGRRDFEKISALYYQHRAELMLKRNEGLTRTYNRFHDPSEQSDDISHLRELHEAMDRVVLDAYGWNDLPIETQFLLDYESEGDGTKAKKPWRFRWTDDVRDEVLARLLALNAERAEVERLKPGGRPKARKHKPNSLPLLFEEQ